MPYPAKENENKKIVKLVEQDNDLSLSDIGEDLGISKQAVHERYQRHSDNVDNS